jgi:hypothetical protein
MIAVAASVFLTPLLGFSSWVTTSAGATSASTTKEIERGERILERMKDPLMQELCEGERATIKLG